jgi:hypothetical protein
MIVLLPAAPSFEPTAQRVAESIPSPAGSETGTLQGFGATLLFFIIPATVEHYSLRSTRQRKLLIINGIELAYVD